MKFHRLKVIVGITLLSSLILSSPISAKPEACKGVSEKCTKDKLYDKTIGGTIYSCYNCKQALCKDGGNGGLAGSSTKSVCTEKATTFQPISQDGQFNGGSNKLAPKAKPPSRIGLQQKLGTSPKANKAISKKSANALPPVGSTCTIMDESESGPVGDYTKLCVYPDGTSWVCTDDLATCKRKTRVTGSKDRRPSAHNLPKRMAPVSRKSPIPKKRTPEVKRSFDEADVLFGKRTNLREKKKDIQPVK